MDWYGVYLAEGDSAELNVYYRPGEGNIDAYFYGPGPQGLNTVLDSDIDLTQTGVLHIEYAMAAGAVGGEYLLKILPNSPPANIYYVEALVRRACTDDLLEPTPPDELVNLVGDGLPGDYAGLVLCNDRDWFKVEVAAGSTVTACVSFNHLDGDIDISAYAADAISDNGAGSPTPIAAPTDSSWTKLDVETVTLSAGAAATTFYLDVFLDPRDQRSTTYSLALRDGAVACP